MSIDYLGWSLDFSSLQMLATLKVISVAFNVYDGTKAEKDLIPIWKKYSISRIPNPLEYLSYLVFYPCVLTGPVYELQDYLRFIDAPSGQLKWSWKQIGKMVGCSAFCMGLYLFLSPIYSRKLLLVPYIYTVPLWQTVFDAFLVGLASRQKYFIAWYLAEGACVTAGFGYDANKDKWLQIQHADFFGVEFAPNLRGVMTNWNQAVSRWLRYYVYTRIGPIEAHIPGGTKKPTLKNTILTFTVSAFWHGFYPGYYLMWSVMAIAQNVATSMHRKTRPRIIDDANPNESQVKKTIYSFFGWLLTSLCLAYYTTSFQLLDWNDSVRYFNRVYWLGHLITFGLFVIVTLIPPVKKSSAKPKAE
jgi:lysophospholipid acyltransferase